MIPPLFLEDNSKRIILYFVLLLFFCLVYILNILFPLQADDWGYSFVFGVDYLKRVTDLSEIMQSQYNHYMRWGGRSVVHSIAQFLLMIDIRIADLLNSLVYIGLFVLIYIIINKGKKANAGLFIVLNIIMWLIQPVFSIIILWLTGSANYLWGTFLIVLFICPYYQFFINKTSTDSVLKCFLFFIWGVISGWTNENTSLALISLLVLLMGYLKYNKIKLPKWAIYGIVGVCIGNAIMILAPGNMVRAEVVVNNLGLAEVSSFKLFKIRLYNLYNAGFVRLSIISGVYLIFLFLFLRIDENKNRKDVLFASFAFFISAFVGFFVLYPTSYFPRDVWTGIHIFFLIAIGLLYVNISFSGFFMTASRALIFVVLVTAFINHYAGLLKEVYYYSERSQDREVLVKEKKSKGIKDIVFSEEMIFPKGSYLTDPLDYDPYYWTNVFYAQYYGLNSAALKKKDEVK